MTVPMMLAFLVIIGLAVALGLSISWQGCCDRCRSLESKLRDMQESHAAELRDMQESHAAELRRVCLSKVSRSTAVRTCLSVSPWQVLTPAALERLSIQP